MSYSLSLTVTFPAGSCTKSNLTVVLGMVSVATLGLSSAKADIPKEATLAAKEANLQLVRVLFFFLPTTQINLPAIIRIVAITSLLVGCQQPQPVVKPATVPAALTRFEYSQIYMGVRTRL